MNIFSKVKNVKPILRHCIANGPIKQNTAIREMSARMKLTPSRWQWNKYKDMFSFYFFLPAIPLALITTYVNIFVGVAQLAPIPEGYEPRIEEYERHPISRFINKFMPLEQQSYETNLHGIQEDLDENDAKRITRKVKQLIAERGDSQAWFYRPVETYYHERMRKTYEDKRSYEGYGP